MRKSKMKITILGCIGVFLIAALILVPAAQAGEKTVKYKYTSQFTKLEYVLLPDVKGHVVGVYERRGVAIFENEVAAVTIRGTFDMIKGKGTFQGYTQLTYEDGSTTLVKISGTKVFAPGSKLRLYKEMKPLPQEKKLRHIPRIKLNRTIGLKSLRPIPCLKND
jgi:hypothetical protein